MKQKVANEMIKETDSSLAMNKADPEAMLENDEALNPYQYGENPYYILQEYESNAERIHLLQKLGVLVQKRSESGKQENQAYVCYINVEGSYFPDFIEEDGCFLTSVPFLDYLQYKFDSVPIAPYKIAMVAEEGRRIEEYALLQPDELDCTIADSAVYNDKQVLKYFELDSVRTGTNEIIKVKDFPHLVVAKKLNRIEFAGVQCTRIDRYFDYEAKQTQLRQEQLASEQPEQLLKRLEEAAVTGREKSLVREYKHQVLGKVVEYDFNRGLRNIFDSLKRQPLRNREPMIDLELTWSWDRQECELTRGQEYFNTTGFSFEYLVELKRAWGRLPEALRPLSRKLASFTVRNCAHSSLMLIERYVRMNIKREFRLCLWEEGSLSETPELIYEITELPRGKPEKMHETSSLDLNHRDLQAEDLSGKKLDGLKINGSNLTRVKFHGSQLNKAEFCSCDLTGAEFDRAILTGVKFVDCRLDRARFNQAELKEAIIENCCLEHTCFAKSNLDGVKMSAGSLFCTYFYRAKLIDAVITVPGPLTGCVFRLCDLRNAQFTGDQTVFDNNLEDCDFRGADLSSCHIATRGVARCRFEGTKLVGADFSECKKIESCDMRWSNCRGLNLDGVWVTNSNLTFVDLSQLYPKKGAVFYGNDLTYANLTGYDFGMEAVLIGNRIIYTNFTDCNLKAAWLNDSQILYPVFQGANLQGAHIKSEQVKMMNLSSKQLREIKIYQVDEEDFEIMEEG